MTNYAEYFARERYQPKYLIGDRVFGRFEKMPFIASVGNDRYISDERGPEVIVHLDLPLMTKNGIRSILTVKHKDIRPLTNFDDIETKKKRK